MFLNRSTNSPISIDVFHIYITAMRLANTYPAMRKRRILLRTGNPLNILRHKMVPLFCMLYCIDCRTMWSDDWSHTFPARDVRQHRHRRWRLAPVAQLLSKIKFFYWFAFLSHERISFEFDRYLPPQLAYMTNMATINAKNDNRSILNSIFSFCSHEMS